MYDNLYWIHLALYKCILCPNLCRKQTQCLKPWSVTRKCVMPHLKCAMPHLKCDHAILKVLPIYYNTPRNVSRVYTHKCGLYHTRHWVTNPTWQMYLCRVEINVFGCNQRQHSIVKIVLDILNQLKIASTVDFCWVLSTIVLQYDVVSTNRIVCVSFWSELCTLISTLCALTHYINVNVKRCIFYYYLLVFTLFFYNAGDPVLANNVFVYSSNLDF